MKIFVTGNRGIPNIPGGIEKHCQELYPLIVEMGHDVVLATRSPYVTEKLSKWRGVRLLHVFAPRVQSLEAIMHTFIAVIRARIECPDIIHIHAVGPGLLVPLAKLLGLKVVVTNHGPDYDRQKWGKPAKAMLRLGEYLGGCFADEVIVISRVIKEIINKRCDREPTLIYNGVTVQPPCKETGFIERIGAVPDQYILAVARFVPEKGLHDLIKAYTNLDTQCRLVIAGDADHETPYSLKLRDLAAQDNRIILTGYITGELLNQVFSHARVFVLSSYHEGLPIALLEAMSYGLSVLVSDIPANMEVGLEEKHYFKCGDVEDLRNKMVKLLTNKLSETKRSELKHRVAEEYNWQRISEQTVKVYENVAKRKTRLKF